MKSFSNLSAPFQEGEEVEATIDRLSYGGNGVCKPKGFALFVPRAAPGDRVVVKVHELRRRFGHARIEKILEASELRQKPPCPFFERCGGCHYQHLKPEIAANIKQSHVQESLDRLGPGGITVKPIIVPEKTWGYRNRLTFHRKDSAQGYVAWDNYEILDIPSCPIASPLLDRIWGGLREVLRNIAAETLPYVVLRETTSSVAIVLSLVKPLAEELVTNLKTFLGTIECKTSLWTTNIEAGSRTPFGDEITIVHGESEIVESILGVRYSVRPDLFSQVHPEITEKIVVDVKEWSKSVSSSILDLYCGAGLFSLALAKEGKTVYGVEMNYAAVMAAQKSAVLNGFNSIAQFRAGKAETILRRLRQEGLRFSSAIVDPPRRGLRRDVIREMNDMGIEHLLYVSCSPPTMARDLKELSLIGFETKSVQPYDMFPQTYHVETLAVLERKLGTEQHSSGFRI